MGGLARGFYRKEETDDGLRPIGYRIGNSFRAVGWAAAVLVASTALVVTPPGHRGVVYSQSGGVITAERVEGLSFIIPLVQSAVQIDVRTQKYEVEAFAQTKDLQEITVPIAVNYHVDPRLAAELYQEVGRDYERVVIRPAVLQHAKAAVGQVRAVDFAVQRAQLATDIASTLEAELAPQIRVATK